MREGIDRYCVAVHAIERYLERVEGVAPGPLTMAEIKRVKKIILAIPAVQAAVKTYATCKVKVPWGRVVVEQGYVVTVMPPRDHHKMKIDKRHKGDRLRYGRRTRAHRIHAEGASY